MKVIVGAIIGVVILLDLLIAASSVAHLPGRARIDPGAIVLDEGLSWRTNGPLLQGRLLAAVPEGGWSPWGVQAKLIDDTKELAQSAALHQEIRTLGAGRWSYWRGQVYFSTSDGSDPRSNGHSYKLEAPLRPTMLLLGGALLANFGAFLLLRRSHAGVRRVVDARFASWLAGLPVAGPGIAGRWAPLLLALAVLAAFCGPYGSDRWMPWDFSSPDHRYLPPYLATLDFWVAALFVLAALATRRAPTLPVVAALLLFALCMILAGIDRGASLSWRPQITGFILASRFACAFLAAWCVARAGGERALVPAVATLGTIWTIGVALALWHGRGQFIVVGGHFPSFAGMTLSLVVIMALHRGAPVAAAISAMAIVATGSRTAVMAWPIAWLLPALRHGRAVFAPLMYRSASNASAPSRRRASPWVIVAVVVVGVGALLVSSQLRAYLSYKLTHSSWLNLGRRAEMAKWTIDTLDQTGWQVLGRGCGTSPAFMDEGVHLGTMEDGWGNLHVIWLQWMVELGALALPLVVLVLWRTAAAWWRAPLAASIWTFFLLSQSFDYWLWTRDGLIVWALFLGLAEGARALRTIEGASSATSVRDQASRADAPARASR